MTDIELSQYKKLIHEAIDLQLRIDKLNEKEIPTTHNTVKGSSKCFPYIEVHFGVWVEEPKQAEAKDNMIKVYQERLDRATKEVMKIEQYINNIHDSELRQIFEYRYIDGKKLREIGDIMNLERSGIGKKIHNYINFPTIPIPV